jgi:serine/threonine-protein kinase
VAPERQNLLALAEAIADGRDVDWAEAESTAGTPQDRELVQQLRLLAGLADVHRPTPTDGTTAPALRETGTAERWGPLQLHDSIGAGSFGSVHRAWDPRLARPVALKLLHRHRADPEDASAIVEEGRLLARVRHPHVITVYGADCIDGRVGIWMEFINGRTLEQVLKQNGPFGAREAASIGVDLCGALAAVHAEGLVHRDVKAQNVMREAGGRIVLMDFGAGQDATSVRTNGATTGTPLYMAPEVLAGGQATARSDLYSLGVLLFRLVTAAYPVSGETALEVQLAHTRGTRQRLRDLRPDLPSAFVTTIERALSPHPDDRFASAGAMEEALVHSLRSGTDSRAPDRSERGAGRPRRASIAFLVGFAALMALILTIAVTTGSIPWPTATRVHTIAVVPFENLTGQPQDEYFVSGVTDLLLTRLADVQSLRVIPPSSMIGFAAGDSNLRAAAAKAKAQHIVEGSVSRENKRMRISIRLIEAGTGELTAAQTYERSVDDLFAVQGEMASAIARAVNARIRGGQLPGTANLYTTSAEAQDAYLHGRYLLYRFDKSVLPEMRREFERAVAIDPQFALAHASLARAYLMLEAYGVSGFSEVSPLAVAAAQRAVELAPDLADARIALAEVRFKCERDWRGAEREYRAAVRLSPNASTVRSPFARFLSAAGRPSEALEHAQAGAAADPLSAEMIASVGITHYYLRQFDEAVAAFERSVQVNPRYGPGYFGRARALTEKREFEAAVRDIKQALTLSGGDRSYLAELARVYAVAGWRSNAEQVLGELGDDARNGRPSAAPQDLAYVYVALGDRARAFELLNEALDANVTRVLFLRVDPRVDRLRGDPRFGDLLNRIGGAPAP